MHASTPPLLVRVLFYFHFFFPGRAQRAASAARGAKRLVPFVDMYTVRRIIIFFSSDTSLRARTFAFSRNVRGGGHNSTVRVMLPGVWARSV